MSLSAPELTKNWAKPSCKLEHENSDCFLVWLRMPYYKEVDKETTNLVNNSRLNVTQHWLL